MKKLFILFFIISILFLPILKISADSISDCPPNTLCNPLGSSNNTIADILKTILDWITTKIGPPLAVLMIVVGGFQMVFASGDPERFRRGKQTIVYTVIGYGIIFLAWGVVSLIQNILGSS